MKSIKPITKLQLLQITTDYHTAFPNWQLLNGERLVRISGVLLQQIGFERLRSGKYRPSSTIRILVTPGCAILHQFLDLRNREIALHEHASVRHRVVGAIEQQFVPSVRRELFPEEVLALLKKNAGPSLNDMTALAGLYAYLGNERTSLEIIRKLEEQFKHATAEVLNWEAACLKYCGLLRDAIFRNDSQSFLQSVFQEEFIKLQAADT